MHMKRSANRLISAAAAAAVACSLFSGTLPAFAQEAASQYVSCPGNELTDVIVKLASCPVLALPDAKENGTDFLDTDEANAAESRLLAEQDSAAAHIRRLYPELEIRRRFTLTENAFSCTLPDSLIPEIERDPLIESVCRVQKGVMPSPQLAAAKELSGADTFSTITGFTGEGEVIAVIDTEFDVSHDMFAPMTDVSTTLSRENIIETKSKTGFSEDIDPESVYLSNKVPFAYDYSDDTPYDLANSTNYHGTHVAGIAAGNRVTDKAGNALSGLAPDAQLLMMKVFDNSGSSDDEDIAAAIEDAVRLKADVINMSFGRIYEYLDSVTYADAIGTASEAGIIICASAGNCGNGCFSSGLSITPENVDTGALSEPSVFPSVISVASADNTVTSANTLRAGENEFPYCECGNMYCIEVFSDGEYDLYMRSAITASELTPEEVSGKIVFFDGAADEYYDFCQRAYECGAIGLIIADDTCADMYESYLFTACLPVAVISRPDGQSLCLSGAKKVTFTSTPLESASSGSLSGFSSWGVPTSLDIKPEIMGIGGSVRSAAYGNSYSLMSGTSMSSPYLAGCSALFDQYMKSQGSTLTGHEKVERVKNILMNSAVPYSDGVSYFSPRRQGAGLVSLNDAINDKVIITGDSNEAKIKLFDKLSDTFTFDITLTNISSEDVTFDINSLRLTTDGVGHSDYRGGSEYISGTTVIESSDDLESTITVPAGTAIKKSVTVKLSPEQLESQSSVYTNGFFVEGYLRLAGAQNCCELTVPVLGFYGDWTKIPTTDEGRYPSVLKVDMGKREMRTDASLADLTALYRDHMTADPYYSELFSVTDPDTYPSSLYYDLTPDEQKRYDAVFDGTTYCSPKNEYYGKYIGVFYVPTREADFSGLDIYTSSGELIPSGEAEGKNSYTTQTAIPGDDFYTSPEGRYKGVLSSYIRYGEAEKEPQKKEFDIVIDNTAPEISYEVIEKDGKKILKLTATDADLDGIYLFGVSTDEKAASSKTWFDSIAIAANTLTKDSLLHDKKPLKDYYPVNALPEETSIFRDLLNGDSLKDTDYNFCDVIPASVSDDGTFTMTYDITDIEELSISVVDRAMNEAAATIGGITKRENFSTGLWYGNNLSTDMYYDFVDDSTVRIISTYDKSVTELTYTIEDGHAKFYKEGRDIPFEADVTIGRKNAAISWNDTEAPDKLVYLPNKKAEDFDFYSDLELEELAKQYYTEINGFTPNKANISFNPGDGTVSIYLIKFRDEGEEVLNVYFIDRNTGTGTDVIGNNIDLVNSLWKNEGVWSAFVPTMSYGAPRLFCFLNATKGIYANISDGVEHSFEYTLKGDKITFDFDSFSELGEPLNSADLIFLDHSHAELNWENGFYEELILHREASMISGFHFFTEPQLTELANAYLSTVSGITPTRTSISYDMTPGIAHISFYDNNEPGSDPLDVYSVSYFTGIGKDSAGNDIDLTGASSSAQLGDVNDDGKIDAKDASAVLAAYAKSSTGADTGLTETQAKAANVNGDTLIDAKDASFILAYYALASTASEVPTMEEFMRSR